VPDVKRSLEAVLTGNQERYELEYPCHSPDAQRWFVMRVKRLSDGSGVVVSHFDITFRMASAGEAVGR
jgi:two-component system CheB/CheR fusion protein